MLSFPQLQSSRSYLQLGEEGRNVLALAGVVLAHKECSNVGSNEVTLVAYVAHAEHQTQLPVAHIHHCVAVQQCKQSTILLYK